MVSVQKEGLEPSMTFQANSVKAQCTKQPPGEEPSLRQQVSASNFGRMEGHKSHCLDMFFFSRPFVFSVMTPEAIQQWSTNPDYTRAKSLPKITQLPRIYWKCLNHKNKANRRFLGENQERFCGHGARVPVLIASFGIGGTEEVGDRVTSYNHIT